MCNRIWFLVHVYIVLLALTKDSIEARKLKNPAIDFNRHSIVQPILHHGRTKRELLSSRDTNGGHHSEVEIKILVNGERFLLDLRLNEDLVTAGHTLQYREGRKTVQLKPSRNELDLCHYSGRVRGKPSSWVAVSTCHGLQGVIFDEEKMWYIEPARGAEIQSPHYLYDHNELNTKHRCGYDGGVTNNTSVQLLKTPKTEISRIKRETDNLQVQGPYKENTQSRYVELVLVADYGEYQKSGYKKHIVHSQLIQVANIINSLYAPLNIFIALVGVVVWTQGDEIALDRDSQKTLDKFMAYRREKLVKLIPNDNAHLLTSQHFDNGVVGKAYGKHMCTLKSSGGVATNHSKVIGLVAATIAHEMGHNFGMDHDDDEKCECPDKHCIMNSYSTSKIPVHWSSCSLKHLALAFDQGLDYCLRNKPKSLLGSPTCGNGFVEPGEQCDCGITTEGGINPCHACCHPDTCMLRSNATCGAGACCDLTTCSLRAAGVVCRSADRECDLPEYCSGISQFCPADVHKMDSTPCGSGDNQAYCVRGSCRSHSDQCRLLWGPTGQSAHHMCYESNTGGGGYGHCGYNRSQQKFEPCASKDILCGAVQCVHYEDKLRFGYEATRWSRHIPYHDVVIQCHTASVDLGINDVDPGLVPEGAKCGEEHMCMNQRCVSVKEVRNAMQPRNTSPVCPANCSGHGVCNTKGRCHCESGFAPPLCDEPGVGGSLDSGPATDPSGQIIFKIVMYVIFLGIIPLGALLFLLLYFRHDILLWWKRPRKSYLHRLACCAKTNSKATTTTATFQHTTYPHHLTTVANQRTNDAVFRNSKSLTAKSTLIKITNKMSSKPTPAVNTQPKTTSVKPVKKITKEDIQIATHGVNLKPVKPLVANKPKPPLMPKPGRLNVNPSVNPKSERLQSSAVIVKHGLASTTNEMLNKGRLYNVGGGNILN